MCDIGVRLCLGERSFFTVVTEGRRPILASVEPVEMLRAAMRHVRDKQLFEIDAMVVLPDHLHCIWTLPTDELNSDPACQIKSRLLQ